MTQQKTTWVVNSITGLKMSQKTGVLTIRRGVGNHLEEGKIEFKRGQIVEAAIGRKHGEEAVNYFTSWTHCEFSFADTAIQNTRPPSTPFPAFEMPLTRKEAHTDNYTTLQPRSTLAASKNQRSTFQSENTYYSSDDPEIPYSTRPLDYGLHLIETRGLTRAHKRLFLLINGKRSIQDIARLLKRDPKEIYELLYDLERTEIIKIPTYSQR
ncbi:MAG TPA: DUF4388 domain-containing protein [Ktedonobacteraceae bacterium]|nr:DUF4388 domain-containing protein [Ktedonobacteraceae bacterium]